MKKFLVLLVIAVAGNFMLGGCDSSSNPPPASTVTITFSPLQDATATTPTVAVTATFSAAVTEPTDWTTVFSLKKDNAGDNLCTTVDYNDTTFVATCNHSALDISSSYTSGVTGLTDAGGLAITAATATFATLWPTVSTVKDGASATIAATGTTGVFPTSFEVTFSEAMDDTSVTTAGNITLTCTLPAGSELAQPTITVTPSDTVDYTYIVTVTDAYKYQLFECTETLTTNITDANGAPLLSEATYVFTNACAMNDDFNTDSQTCWAADTFPSALYTSWAAILAANALSFADVDHSYLIYDQPTASDSSFYITKTATASADMEILIHFDLATGFVNNTDRVLFGLQDATNANFILAGITKDPTQQICWAGGAYHSGTPVTSSAACTSATDDYYIKVVVVANVVTEASYSTDGVTFTNLTGGTPVVGLTIDSTLLSLVVMEFRDKTAAGITAWINKVTLSGVTVTGQY